MKSWVPDKGLKIKYNIKTESPIDIVTDDDVEISRLKLIFFNHDIKFKLEKT